jgi:hypothetical protein
MAEFEIPLYGKLNSTVIAMVVIMIIIIIFMWAQARPVDNKIVVNTTAGQVEKYRFEGNVKVPADYITPEFMLIAVVWLLITVYVITKKQDPGHMIISGREALACLKEEIYYRRDVLKIKKYQGEFKDGAFQLLKIDQEGKGYKPWAYIYSFSIVSDIEESDFEEQFFQAEINAYTKQIHSIIERDTELTYENRHKEKIKYILPEEIITAEQVRRGKSVK